MFNDTDSKWKNYCLCCIKKYLKSFCSLIAVEKFVYLHL